MPHTTDLILPCGPVTAALTDDNLIHARGIPYATAARFQPPQPTNWTTPLDCTTHAPICPQLPSRLESVMGPLADGHPTSETCLVLSITAPRHAHNAPVLVWLHGGAYISGGGDLASYQPSDLAARGIVCINVTYRLGVFGYLPLTGVAPANLGLRDQIAALRWVRANIAAVGGDAGNVTLAGQSAGADSVVCIMVAEGTRGLFRRVILMSGPLGEIRGRAEAQARLLEKAERLFTKDPREMTTAEMLDLQKELLLGPVRRRIMLFAPAFGAYPLPGEDEVHARIVEAARDVPVLLGWTAHDGRPFASMGGPLCGLYKVPFLGGWLEALGTWYMTRAYFSLPAQRLHARLIQAGCACHTIDLPFVLGSRGSWTNAPMLRGANPEEVRQLGVEVKNLWTRFMNGGQLTDQHIAIRTGFVTSDDMFIE